MTSRSWSIGSSRSRARRATLLPLLEAERRRLRGAAVPRFALMVCCGFAGLRLVARRRLTLSPPWARPPRADDLTLAHEQGGWAARPKLTLAGPSWVTTGKAFAASFRKTAQCR